MKITDCENVRWRYFKLILANNGQAAKLFDKSGYEADQIGLRYCWKMDCLKNRLFVGAM